MTFLNPAGLWLLLGIPLVILLYILKPPVKEKAVSSTFLWKLSEKFMKKKSPFRRFRRIFLLILQIVTVLTLSLIAAKPVFLRKDCTDYILILDTSASMQMADDQGQTRLADRAVGKEGGSGR